MPSKLYFTTATPGSVKPSARQSTKAIQHWIPDTNGGGQDGASSFYPCSFSAVPGSSTQTDTSSYTEPGAAHQGWVKAFVSLPLAAQTFNPGTAWFIVDWLEGNGQQNMFVSAFAYIWKGDNSGIRGILFGTAAAPWVDTTTEIHTTLGTLQSTGNATVSSVSISDGDVLVVELMWNDNNTKTTSYTHTVTYNGVLSGNYEANINFGTSLTFKSTTTSLTKTSQARFKTNPSLTKTSQSRFWAQGLSQTKTSQSRFLKPGITQTLTEQSRFVKTYSPTLTTLERFLATLGPTLTSMATFTSGGPVTQSKTLNSQARFLANLAVTLNSQSRFKTNPSQALGSQARFLKTFGLTETSLARFLYTGAPTLNSLARYKTNPGPTLTCMARFGTETGTPGQTLPEWLKVNT